MEAARRTVRFPPSEGVGRENRKEESCVDKVEKVEQCGGRRKILGGRKNNGDTRGKGIGFFGIDEEGASRSVDTRNQSQYRAHIPREDSSYEY